MDLQSVCKKWIERFRLLRIMIGGYNLTQTSVTAELLLNFPKNFFRVHLQLSAEFTFPF